MTTTQLIIILLVIIVAVALVLLVVRWSAARRDRARVEAAELRARAEEVAGAVQGQQQFAAQAEERAAVARAEAEAARQAAAQLEAEAEARRAAADTSRREYEEMLGRADEVDPDVRGSGRTHEAAPEVGAATTAPQVEGAEPVAEDGPPEDRPVDGEGADRQPTTRAEARQMREEAERAAWAGSPAAPVPGAAGAAVIGAGTWAEPHDEDQASDAPAPDAEARQHGAREDEASEDELGAERTAETQEPEGDADRSARIAAATDYRDAPETEDGPRAAATQAADASAGDDTDVWEGSSAGTGSGMTTPGSDDTLRDRPAEAGAADDTTVGEGTDTAADDARTPSGEWGGPHDAAETTSATTATDEPHAAAEPAEGAAASDDAAGVSRGDADAAEGPVETAAAGPATAAASAGPEAEATATDDETAAEHVAGEPSDETPAAEVAPDARTTDTESTSVEPTEESEPAEAETDAAIPAEPELESAGDPWHEANQDWGSAERAKLEESHARGDRLHEDFAQMEREAAAAGMDTVHEVEPEPEESRTDEPAADRAAGEEPTDRREEPSADVATDQADEASVEERTDQGDGEVTDESSTEGTWDEQSTDADSTDEEATDEQPTDDEATDAAPSDEHDAPESRRERRISEFHEIRDGGFGMGSAATIEDGAQPMDHPVQAYRDTMTYRVPGDPGYEDAEPDVWFYDAGAAERSGFHRSEG